MNFDFALFLVIATFSSGLIWAIDSLVFAKGRAGKLALEAEQQGLEITEKAEPFKPLLVDYAQSFFPVLLVVLVIRSFIAEPFRIPSGSMFPTLLVGDFILVNKFKYGIRLPVTNEKIIAISEPKRGDVVVFRYPENPSLDYIKRVVGIPGDHIAYYDKVLKINGKLISNSKVGLYEPPDKTMPDPRVIKYSENLDGVKHNILMTNGKFSTDGETVVPPGKYFVMGDNRDNSNDSRYWGFVPEENLRGEAFMIWMNWDSVNTSVMFSRLGSSID